MTFTFEYGNINFSECLEKSVLSYGGFTREHEKHALKITADNNGTKKTFSTVYQYAPKYTTYKNGDGLRAVLLDAQAFAECEGDIDAFAGEFGYNKPSECLNAYNGCKRAFEFFEGLGLGWDDLNNMREIFGE